MYIVVPRRNAKTRMAHGRELTYSAVCFCRSSFADVEAGPARPRASARSVVLLAPTT